MLFYLKYVARVKTFSIDMHGFIFQEEVSIVHYTAPVESFHNELLALEVGVNLNHTQLNDLDGVHGVTWLEDELALVILLAVVSVEQLHK